MTSGIGTSEPVKAKETMSAAMSRMTTTAANATMASWDLPMKSASQCLNLPFTNLCSFPFVFLV